jgi:hypothetical protein
VVVSGRPAKFFKFYGVRKELSWHSLIRNWLMYIRLARRLCRLNFMADGSDIQINRKNGRVLRRRYHESGSEAARRKHLPPDPDDMPGTCLCRRVVIACIRYMCLCFRNATDDCLAS